ncbi:uncharacterized protein BDW70DRAFT_128510 [Aspergillus foveolatus]|uniref:uncharacterized protein n=1 Tax=Aspergillus foveolatus TaxID=210207 RepID=UPI003CCE19D2
MTVGKSDIQRRTFINMLFLVLPRAQTLHLILPKPFALSCNDWLNPLPKQLTYQVYIPPLYLLTSIAASPTN